MYTCVYAQSDRCLRKGDARRSMIHFFVFDPQCRKHETCSAWFRKFPAVCERRKKPHVKRFSETGRNQLTRVAPEETNFIELSRMYRSTGVRGTGRRWETFHFTLSVTWRLKLPEITRTASYVKYLRRRRSNHEYFNSGFPRENRKIYFDYLRGGSNAASGITRLKYGSRFRVVCDHCVLRNRTLR